MWTVASLLLADPKALAAAILFRAMVPFVPDPMGHALTQADVVQAREWLATAQLSKSK